MIRRLLFLMALTGVIAALLRAALPADAGRASFAVHNQLIIIGGEAEIFEATMTISDSLQPLQVADLAWFDLLPPEQHPFGGQIGVTAWLLQIINPALTVEGALGEIEISGADVVASPNWVVAAAAPWYIEGAPSVPPALVLSDAALTGQAAFTQINYSDGLAFSGDRVRVGVFDTSAFNPGLAGTFSTAVKSLPLVVHHEVPLPSPSPVPTTTDYAEHGPAVASLSGAIAPLADYHLYRVLNPGGVGDLFALTFGLSAFVDSSEAALAGGTIDAALINLSLVVHSPLGDPLPTLDAVLLGAHLVGIEIVAAAGNEADHTGALPSKAPAAFSYVLAVAAAELGDTRSCFSHVGDIGAGGGDALDGGVCEPPTMTERIRGWAVADGMQVEWAGTSFATPLAAGAAVLLLDQHDGQPEHERAADILLRTARQVADDDLGRGIVDLGAALSAPPLTVQLSTATAVTTGARPLTVLLPTLAVITLIANRRRGALGRCECCQRPSRRCAAA